MQLETLQDNTELRALRERFEQFGTISLDEPNQQMRITLKKQRFRAEAMLLLEDHLDRLISLDENETSYEHQAFALTDRQLNKCVDELDRLAGDVKHFGTLSIDEGFLLLRIRHDAQSIKATHTLEKRLGVLVCLPTYC